MKPPRFEYFAPRTVDEACSLLASRGDGARVLAGGQSLIPLLNFRLAHPDALVDINRIGDLAYLRADDGGMTIGALTRQHAVERSDLVRARVPILAEACRFIGHAPIRHRGTIGGNLAHADPASELPAVMVALEAQLTLSSTRGNRTLPAHRFFVSPLCTSLETGEMLTEVRVPAIPASTGGAFVEMARRAGDYALVGVAALITLDGSGRCQRARVALCGVGPTPIRASAAEEALMGQTPTGATLDEAANRAAAVTNPPSDVHGSAAFRTTLARHFTRQAIRAGGPARGRDLIMPRTVPIGLNVNGIRHELAVEPRWLLVDVIREVLGLTGTHIGCEHGVCGTCTVLVNGETTRSCLMLAVTADGAEILTVEGLSRGDQLHPLQQAFREAQGLQCGFCTPGMLLLALELLRENPAPSEQEIREAISANLCRCTGYQGIVEAVRLAAAQGAGVAAR